MLKNILSPIVVEKVFVDILWSTKKCSSTLMKQKKASVDKFHEKCSSMAKKVFVDFWKKKCSSTIYYIALVIFSTFQHKSTNTFFLQKSMNTFFTTMGLRIFFNISTHIDEHLIYYIALVIFSPLFVYIQWYIMYCYPL